MRFSESLKKNADFKHLYKYGDSRADSILVLYSLPNGSDRNRVGISVSKKVGNSVGRHHLTRLIREVYRLNEDRLKSGFDLAVVVRVRGKNASVSTIEKHLLTLLSLQGIVRTEE